MDLLPLTSMPFHRKSKNMEINETIPPKLVKIDFGETNDAKIPRLSFKNFKSSHVFYFYRFAQIQWC